MDDIGYRGGATIGGKWGCALSALIGVPLIGFTILVSTLGDCVPDEPCNHGIIWSLLIPSILIAVLVGIGSRAVINWIVHRRQSGS